MRSEQQAEQYALQIDGHFIKLMHTCAGVYIWEFVTTLDFEWEIYTGKRPWRWSFIVYVAARVLALICFTLSLVGFNLTRQFNCNFTAWFASSSASFLLVLRGVAIWGRDSRIVVLTGLFWLANLGQAAWSPALRTCAITRTDEYRWSIMINFIQDFVLLVVMIFGVLHKRNATHLWNMLYFQALFWILAAVMTELPSVAMGFKNINGEVITSSRAYRDLFQYITGDQDSYSTRRGRQPQGMQAVQRSGRDMRVTVTKTIEFDVELRLGRGRRGDEENDYYTPGLTEEEQQIRTLELQMKQDLEI
ncbi:hypothetical protein DFH94DRAFT_762762 [Russula ochroleuca]|uniref:Uncharacterized protein n=1 Tax=Russula ochroleuca TaxID=152965 RepID=A0A9P5K2G3_9AGAM|nr:hypothetical protein DFH94DRAFT_762762 [Russula ochroleuca]